VIYKVYRNLNNGKLSVKEKKSGLVVGHCDKIEMSDCIFSVSEKGVERIRRLKQKAVVATVDGAIQNMVGFESFRERAVSISNENQAPVEFERATFNPYFFKTFVLVKNETPIFKASFVKIDGTGVIKVKQ